MFGMEQQSQEMRFELEEELRGEKGQKRAAELIQLAEQRIKAIKEALTKGQDKSTYSRLETLLKGYEALKEIIPKITRAK